MLKSSVELIEPWFSFQMLSRQKPAIGPGSSTPAKENKKKKKLPKVEEFLENRDYTGAITLLEVTRVTWSCCENFDSFTFT